MSGFFHDGGTRVVSLVYAVAEAHQLDAVLFILDLIDEGLNRHIRISQLNQHAQHRLVRPTVQRTSQRAYPGSHRSVQVRVR